MGSNPTLSATSFSIQKFIAESLDTNAAPLGSLVREMMDEAARTSSIDALHCLRDPTRGGVATTLNAIALSSEVCIEIQEDRIPVREEVKGACEILGLDPLYVANEGKLLALVASEVAEPLIERMRESRYGRDAGISGEVKRAAGDCRDAYGLWRHAHS